jgi:PleD family two-component response regulator/EAL domain-containing protein (putative c-di-GMP-specific phosphodiesterase class I)
MGLDEIVNATIDNNAPPSDAEMDELSASLERLQDDVLDTTPVEEQITLEPTWVDLLYLPKEIKHADPLPQAFDAQSWRCRGLTSAEELKTALSHTETKVLLVDATYLDDAALAQAIDKVRKDQEKNSPELFFLSEQSDIETRLKAMRLGAKHLFTQPFDIDELMSSLKAATRPAASAHPRVLIVEDDESQAKFAASLMQKSGIDTYEIHNPLNVIEGVCRFQPDLILMDLYMPGADGIELTRLIRDRKETQAIPIVFLSGEDDPEKKLLALHAGADDFLTKPVRPQQLLTTVSTRIERLKTICASSDRLRRDPLTGLPTRRELLTNIDLAIAKTDTFGAILVCTFSPGEDVIEDFDREKQSALLKQASTTIQPLLKKGDLLARNDRLSFAILFERNREDEVEEMGEAIYKALLPVAKSEAHEQLGVGIALIDSSVGRAHNILGHAETSAEHACREGITGYQLHGEVTTPQAEPESQSTEILPREKFLHALSKGLIDVKELAYTGRQEHSVETVELLPEFKGESQDPYAMAAEAGLLIEFNRYICEAALQRLGERVMAGNRGKLIFMQSSQVAKQANYVDFLKTELRKRQIVGTGLMIEFDLLAMATDFKQAKALMGELKALGISVSLSNFACNETAYKVLAYLKGNAVRPHVSLLKSTSSKIEQIAEKIHALDAEIILPRVASHDQISLQWSQTADYLQTAFSK